ncbi:hypothetical protein WICPIJ_008439 [Wickerhamomyces pijperi]|uniref:5-formyltetrahydrofolate cyclo-ligase n=1 Tax=Wickerhamomyces pijperi TaxID=599730 RepID=A0A9P8TIG2_WICPI|nr:hypothetical protein WICPIJ_008439 [Wickerhamomyces pijperi]
MSTQTIKQAKTQLRRKIASKLTSLTQKELERQSNNVYVKLIQTPNFQTAKKVALYMSMPTSEVQTLQFIKVCFEMGKQVYLPHCHRIKDASLKRYDAQRAMLIFYEMPDFQSVLDLKPQGQYQLLEPTSGNSLLEPEKSGNTSEKLDLLVLPGVAFTSDRYRMGHGAGFYDDFIQRHVSTFGEKPHSMIGVGLKEQLVDVIPLESHDERLDAVIVDDMIFDDKL